MSIAVDIPPEAPSGGTVAPSGPAGAGLGPSNLRSHLLKGTARLLTLLVVDLAAIGSAAAALRFARSGGLGSAVADWTIGLFPPGFVASVQLAVAIAVSFYFTGSYRDGDRWREPVRILTASAAGTAIAFYSDFWHGAAAVVTVQALLVWLALGPLLVTARALAGVVTKRFAEAGMKHHVLEVKGSRINGGGFELGHGYSIVSSVAERDLPGDVGSIERLLPRVVDTIIVRGELPAQKFGALIDVALTHGYRLLCAPYASQLSGVNKQRVWVEGHPLVELTTPGLRASHLVLKRGLDLAIAGLILILTSPLLLVLAVWIKLDSPGPAFFRQRRPGIHGRSFGVWKFRSMRLDAEDVLGRDALLYERFLGNGCKLPDGEDPRITRVGRFLRRTSLDELPQLFNVLRGEMSLVGPRPLVGPELENYGERVSILLSVKPGITGLWQVSGRSAIPFPERAEMDLEYVRNWSFLGDLWILLLTPAAVVLRRGAH